MDWRGWRFHLRLIALQRGKWAVRAVSFVDLFLHVRRSRQVARGLAVCSCLRRVVGGRCSVPPASNSKWWPVRARPSTVETQREALRNSGGWEVGPYCGDGVGESQAGGPVVEGYCGCCAAHSQTRGKGHHQTRATRRPAARLGRPRLVEPAWLCLVRSGFRSAARPGLSSRREACARSRERCGRVSGWSLIVRGIVAVVRR